LKVVVVYASGTGNTRETAECAAEGAARAGAQVDLYNVYMLDASILLEGDAVLIGEPTHGDGEHHGDFIPFDKSMAELLVPGRRLEGIPAAAFVGCDRAYRNFGGAIELVENRLVECGARIIQKGLKIELKHNDHSRLAARQWAHDFVRRARGELPVQAYRPAMTRDEVDSLMGVTAAERARRGRQGLG
jgi:flavodoxin I